MKEWLWRDSDDGHVSTRIQEIIRCKDCIYSKEVFSYAWKCTAYDKVCFPDYFCADGRKRE